MRVSPRLASVALPESRSLNKEGAECCNGILQLPVGPERSLARKLFDRRTGSHPHQQRDGEECYTSEWECDKRSFNPNAQARHQTWEPHWSTGYIKGEGG